MATWLPTFTSRLRSSPGTNRTFYLARRVYDPEKVFGQQFAKALVNLANAFGFDGEATLEAPAINPPLDGDVCLGFDLLVALSCILAVVVLKRALDVHGVRIVSFNEIGVVAVHRPDEVCERG